MALSRRLSDHQIRELIRFRELVRDKFPDAGIKVFGSAAAGLIFSFSDIDVAVVSEHFAAVPWADRIRSLRDLCKRGSPVAPIGIVKAELARSGKCYPSVLRSVRRSRDVDRLR
ncbi:MAG: nucleotidyltransferase domain-containing protein, partial [Acetobacteraceae bacterium]|nr:nucleotidyltransferase domain-containing protein [Acetobacteraceae bacterium]